MMKRCVFLVLLLPMSAVLHAADGNVKFRRDVEPILREHCHECHGKESREGGLRFTGRDEVLLTNDSGKVAIVPGKPEESEMIRRLKSSDPELRMPLDKPSLDESSISIVEAWIRNGAKWPNEIQSQHWAYRAPKTSAMPKVRQRTWPVNEIDFFVLANMESNDLIPNKIAEPARLIRRVYLDLIGLPPSIAEIDEFLSDPSRQKYEEIVDRLLASKHYGEKWARRWLDMARYSDSNGYQADQIRHMWAFRDWVIQAMNDDMPFDQFTIEQIAGDLLPNATLSQKIATGFHRATTCNVEAGVDPEGNRIDQVIDRVNTTATVWLGTTFECAQCHNHKYDPFTQQDYYQFFAFFNNTPVEVKNAGGVQFDFWGPKLELPLTSDQERETQKVSRQLKTVEHKLAESMAVARREFANWEDSLTKDARSKLPKNTQQILKVSQADRTKQQTKRLEEAYISQIATVKHLQARQKKLRNQLNAMAPDTTLVMTEMAKPRDSHLLIRGNFLNKGISVVPDTPRILHSFPKDTARNRLGLAKWLIRKENPLVARVVVNRWWNEIFGHGLVATSEDFGSQGEPPTHPKLLDWLAVEFMQNGWSMKYVHKLICLSATYRQSSKWTEQKLRRDPRNRWLSRGAKIRLPAELIRDNALRISGLLSDHMGGPPVFPPQPEGLWNQTGRNEPVYKMNLDEKRFRRGIYVIWRRAAPPPGFVAFDAPDRMSCVVDRPVTNTPLQALTLLNDTVFVEAAKQLAFRVITDCADRSLKQQLDFAFRCCLARRPTAEELDVLRQLFLDEHGKLSAHQIALQQILKDVPFDIDALTEGQKVNLAAWFCIANALLNLDETITKS